MNPHAFTEPPVLAALIAALSALVLAVVQFFAQRKQSNSIEELKARLSRESEELKARFSRESEELKARLSRESAAQTKYFETYLNLVLEGRHQQSQAYASLLQGIQLLRDKIRHFLQQPESYDRDVMHQEIMEQADAIVIIYSANQLQLGEVERKMAHHVKTIATEIATQVGQLRGSAMHNPDSADHFHKIRQSEELLSRLQAELRQHAVEAKNAFVREIRNGKTLS